MKINKKSYEDILIKAAKAFVLAAYPKVPVETGMSRGSFLKLARKLKITIPIVPKRHKIVTKKYETKTGKEKIIQKTFRLLKTREKV